MNWNERRRLRTLIRGVLAPVQTTQNFNQLQYTIPFQTDDSYEDWSPTRPQAYYANPLYPNMNFGPSGGGPIFNTRMRDADDIDGDVSARKLVRKLRRVLKRAA